MKFHRRERKWDREDILCLAVVREAWIHIKSEIFCCLWLFFCSAFKAHKWYTIICLFTIPSSILYHLQAPRLWEGYEYCSAFTALNFSPYIFQNKPKEQGKKNKQMYSNERWPLLKKNSFWNKPVVLLGMFFYKYCRSWNEYLLQPKPAAITGLTSL